MAIFFIFGPLLTPRGGPKIPAGFTAGHFKSVKMSNPLQNPAVNLGIRLGVTQK